MGGWGVARFLPSMRIPGGMRRPAMTRKALGFDPPAKTGRADSAGIESVPGMQTGTHPAALFGRRPLTKRAADARPGSPVSLFDFGLAIENRR